MYRVKKVEHVDVYEELKRLREERNLFMLLTVMMTVAFCTLVQMVR